MTHCLNCEHAKVNKGGETYRCEARAFAPTVTASHRANTRNLVNKTGELTACVTAERLCRAYAPMLGAMSTKTPQRSE